MGSRRAGRYVLHDPIASGGMASVHLGRVVGPAGFSRTVAIKRLHPHLASDPEFVAMFLDEGRLASRIHHPNVVSTIDVVTHDGELLLVMDYVLGESWWHILSVLRERGERIPLDIISAVVGGVLSGLHAAHEARSETGEPLEIVHRDISPQNVLVGVDGVARVVDFGIAKAISRVHSTRDGELKGKLRYMTPEQIARRPVDRRADIYAAGVVLWESLTGARLYTADDAAAIIVAVLEGKAPPPSSYRDDVPLELDHLVRRAIGRAPDSRPSTALEFVDELEAIVVPAPARAVAEFVGRVASSRLEERRKVVSRVEQTPSDLRAVGRDEGPLALPLATLTPEQRKELVLAQTDVSIAGPPDRADPPKADIHDTVTMADPSTGAPHTVRIVDPHSVKGETRRRWQVLVLGLVATVAALGAYVRVNPREKRTQGSPTTPTALGSTATIPEAVGLPAVTVGDPHAVTLLRPLPPPSAVDPQDSTFSGNDPHTVGPSSSAATHHPGPHRQQPSHAPQAAPSASVSQPPPTSDCSPPYTLDANGVKRFKPGCI
jgi:serine/threonine-protein kinase